MNNPDPESYRLWTKDFILTSLSNLFLFFSFHLLTPTLPVYVVEMGGDQFAAGMVVGIFTVTALLIRPFAGRALDGMDRKKVLYFGLFVFTISVITYEWMMIVSLILLVRTIQGIGWGVATTTYATMVSELIGAKRRAEGMGWFGLSINIAMAFAPLLGIWVMVEYGFTLVFILATISILISLLLSYFIDFKQQSLGKINLETGKGGFIEKSTLLPAFLIMLVTISHGGILGSLTLFGQEAGIKNVGWFFMSTAFIMMISRPVSGKVADTKGHVYVLIPGAIFIGIGFLLLSNSSNAFALVIAALFYGMGFGSIQPTLQAWTIYRVAPHRRGVATATYFSAFDLGIGVGALWVGFLAQWLKYSMIFKISITFMILFVIAYTLYLVNVKKREAANKYSNQVI